MPRFETIAYDRPVAGVARITMQPTAKGAAFTSTKYRELRDAVRLADLEPDIDIAVVASAASDFATGGDLHEVLASLDSGDPLAHYKFTDSSPWEALRHASVTTIAAVSGRCLGGGLIAALCCDFVVADQNATFALPEVRVGVFDPWSTQLLAASIGAHRARDLALTGRSISAAEGQAFGFVSRIAETGQLDEAVTRLIGELHRTDPTSRQLYKQESLRFVGDLHHWDSTRYLHATPSAQAGLRKFAEARARKAKGPGQP